MVRKSVRKNYFKAYPHYAPINIMPHYPPTGQGGARWGFVILASTKAPPLGATLAHKSPLIPCIGGGAAVGKWGMEENMVQYAV